MNELPMTNAFGIQSVSSGRRETHSPPLVFQSVLDPGNFQAAHQPHAVAIVLGDEKITYGEIVTRGSAMASGLAAMLEGRRGRPIAVCTDGTYHLVVAALASWKTG